MAVRNQGNAIASFAGAIAALALAGCSGLPSLPGLTTGAVAPTPAAAPQVKNDPTTRAFQVGTASARAMKCGFNFDPVKLKNSYLAYEAAQASAPAPAAAEPAAAKPAGAPAPAPAALAPAAPVDLAQVEKIYAVSFNGVAKAVAQAPEYCTDAKVKTVRADLQRHLAGDYAPRAAEVREEEAAKPAPEYKMRLPTDNLND